MSNYRAGDIIRLTREYIGMSREELSDGICSTQTLYRLECGKTRVKKDLYSRLMAKMERVPEKNYAVCVGKNMELLEERELLEKAMRDYDFEKADKYLKELKEKADDNLITKQYVLKAEALLDYYCKRCDGEETIKKLEEAIRITLPDYEKCLQKKFPFTEQEIMNLMSLANAFAHTDKYDKAIAIYRKLLECLDMEYILGEYVEHMKMIITRNLSLAYFAIEKIEEALELNEKCLELAKGNNEGREYHILLSDKAAIILEQIEKGERDRKDIELAKKYLRQSYHLAIARGDEKAIEIYKKVYKEEMCENM